MIYFKHINKAMLPLKIAYNENCKYEIQTFNNDVVEIAENVANEWTNKEDVEDLIKLITKTKKL
jgi:aminoglycoside/choline kinase family phosphotransferase